MFPSTPCFKLSRLVSPLLASVGLVTVGFGSYAVADTETQPTYIGMTPQDVGVMDRPRPEYDAKGIPLGGFRLFPSLTASFNYDDNVFRLPDATSDIYFEERPQVRLESEWGRHFLEFYGGADNQNYLDQKRLNLTDWTIGTDGRYDVARGATVTALTSYGEFHESLESPNTIGAQAAPNRYFQTHARFDGSYQPNRLGLALGGSLDRYDWQSTPLIGGGLLDNSDRNETEYETYARVFYSFSPGYSGFIRALYNQRDFDLFFDRDGLHRSSNGFQVDGGADVQLTHLLDGEVYIGYLTQRYAKNVPLPLPDVSGLDFGAGVNWFATPLITVHLKGARTLEDTTIYGAAASDDKQIALSADYEFRRNIIVQAALSYTDSIFSGTKREDQYPTAGLALRYLMNRYTQMTLGYRYSRRTSDLRTIDFTDNQLSAGVALHI